MSNPADNKAVVLGALSGAIFILSVWLAARVEES